MRCPYCDESDRIFRVDPRGPERMLRMLGFPTYLCRNCYQRIHFFVPEVLEKPLRAFSRWLRHEVLIIRYIHAHPDSKPMIGTTTRR